MLSEYLEEYINALIERSVILIEERRSLLSAVVLHNEILQNKVKDILELERIIASKQMEAVVCSNELKRRLRMPL